jgi:N-acyl-D-aspartate/D-glutamate deacylase
MLGMLVARAQARGVSPVEEAYDRFLDRDGNAMFLIAVSNFENGSLDCIAELMRRNDTVLGLGDGGAHYGMICDASYPTSLLTHGRATEFAAASAWPTRSRS